MVPSTSNLCFSAWLVWTPVAWSPGHSPSSTHSRPCPCGASAQSTLSPASCRPLLPQLSKTAFAHSSRNRALRSPGPHFLWCRAASNLLSLCPWRALRTASSTKSLNTFFPHHWLHVEAAPTQPGTRVCWQILWTGIRTLQPMLKLIKGLSCTFFLLNPLWFLVLQWDAFSFWEVLCCVYLKSLLPPSYFFLKVLFFLALGHR